MGGMGGAFTRRDLLVSPALAVAAHVPAQAQAQEAPEALLEQARESVRRNREALRAHKVPMAAEPAFQFKA
jgi:hypothetical protein